MPAKSLAELFGELTVYKRYTDLGLACFCYLQTGRQQHTSLSSHHRPFVSSSERDCCRGKTSFSDPHPQNRCHPFSLLWAFVLCLQSLPFCRKNKKKQLLMQHFAVTESFWDKFMDCFWSYPGFCVQTWVSTLNSKVIVRPNNPSRCRAELWHS